LVSGTVVVADQQSAGRGRQGRQWQSPPGMNLHATVLLKPPLPGPVEALPRVAALAIHAAVLAAEAADAWVKWPNDVLVGDRKLAGVLCETRWQGSEPQAVVVGMGVNLNMPPELLAVIDRPATSLLVVTGQRVERGVFLRLLLDHFNHLLARAHRCGMDDLLPDWRAASRLPGRVVRLLQGDRVHHGRVAELARDGSLVLRLADGSLQAFHAGEVSLRWDDSPAG